MGAGPLTNWDAQPLGQEPDRLIAERLGCDSTTVQKARLARGIPSCSKRGGVRESGRKRIDPTPEEVALFVRLYRDEGLPLDVILARGDVKHCRRVVSRTIRDALGIASLDSNRRAWGIGA